MITIDKPIFRGRGRHWLGDNETEHEEAGEGGHTVQGPHTQGQTGTELRSIKSTSDGDIVISGREGGKHISNFRGGNSMDRRGFEGLFPINYKYWLFKVIQAKARLSLSVLNGLVKLSNKDSTYSLTHIEDKHLKSTQTGPIC